MNRKEMIRWIRKKCKEAGNPDFYSWEELAKMSDGDLQFIIYEMYG
jgi:hypothetical protein